MTHAIMAALEGAYWSCSACAMALHIADEQPQLLFRQEDGTYDLMCSGCAHVVLTWAVMGGREATEAL